MNFAARLSQLGTHAIKIGRFNRGRQPMAFVQNPAVKALLDKGRAEALPIIVWARERHSKGGDPDMGGRRR